MRRFNLRKILSYGAVIGLLIFLHLTGIISPVESLITKTLSPVESKLFTLSSKLRFFYNQQTDKRDLNKINSQLSDRVNQLTQENANLKSLEEENQTLRSYLKFLANKDKHYLMADIISKGDMDNSNQIITINKGSKDGLFVGLAIAGSDGNVAGKILTVKDNLSEACLVTSSRCQFAGSIQNKDKTIGIAEGNLGLTIQMNFIPQNENIKIGDIVVTSGLEKNIPRGLVIGQVSQINKENNELWQSSTIEPLSDPNDLLFVSVLLP